MPDSNSSNFGFVHESGEVVPERQALFTQEFATGYWKIYSYVMTLVVNRHDVDDVMQDVAVIQNYN
ncbi:hypothetical protein [Calycomorphotria hydatis]|uniref:Uncharacterized protein n=1 Tax=Calycomorphotria hydatis TaxID=2528027 RepID=A0A517T9Z5_9PLAN|nr:hypothetical protein [Calycomorphotria hydatis]QDT65179.1 hypothetical protein V22_24260 [Calycomorphotria hydatis]